jgi:pilus assembly protein CpaF
MPRFDIEKGDAVDQGVNLNDLKVKGQRKLKNFTEDIQERGQWNHTLEIINAELIKTAGDLLVNKKNQKEKILQQVRNIIERKQLTSQEKAEAYDRMESYLFGFGILDKHMRNSQITEIIIDAPDKIDVEVGGKLYRLGLEEPFENEEVFQNDEELQLWTDNLMKMAKEERSLNYNNPIVNVELVNGERVEATCPPVTEHITVNIRKSVKQTKKYTPEDQINTGCASPILIEFILAAARGKAQILLLGPTGTGKTTWVRILMENGFFPEERVLMIEDVRETNALLMRFLSMQTVGKKITMQDLFKETVRKRPDRICVSEIRGEEASIYLESAAAGHEGSLTTMHAGNPGGAVFLLIMRMRQAEYNMSEQFLERYIHNQVNIMIFLARTRDGRRRISRVVEVNSLDNPNVPKFKDIFLWDPITDTFKWVNDIEPDKRRDWTINESNVPIFPGKEGETSAIAG